MVSKRRTPEEDFDRFFERFFNEFPFIKDRETFDKAFNEYLEMGVTPEQDEILREQTWNRIKDSSSFNLHKEADGKDLSKDRQHEAKKVVDTVQQYKKKGATRTDLRGFDTPKKRKNFDVVGKVAGKIVYAHSEVIQYKKGKQIKYRDRKGRFVSVK